ncbi:transcriptional regulator FtrA [Luteibacter yeojuensis]|uniref:Transcriptional regulator n=1 Tax=Luteibacter yeojuensis TaxID=345309 RepID=A0A0F3KPL7_9GAMM|nr:transcriptional regulator FtrA [Luteibacter yeojuensis]KJV32044.1 transcriptional regulator [Luteibacter yeojuensis]
MPKPRPSGPLVTVLLYDGLCMFEFACASEVFGLARPEAGPGWYRFTTCATKRTVHGQYGTTVRAEAGLDVLATAGTVVIPGWAGIDVPVPAAITAALRSAHARGARLVSICSGAAVLAATGLLDGKRVATHWRYAQQLKARYPAVDVDASVLYVDEGQLLSSAGSAAGLDLCLHLVRRDHGPEVANQVARRLVIPPHRDGGQAQFVERPVAVRDRDPMAALLDTMRRRLGDDLPVAELAAMAAMSERTFLRRFKAATGSTPADWLIGARVDRARELLESSTWPIDRIAGQAGFGTAVTMRHHFRRKLGTSPQAYRARFAG